VAAASCAQFAVHPALFDFDHREPAEKAFNWNKLRLRRWETIKAELDKCDLLCAYCHRLRHLNPQLRQQSAQIQVTPAGLEPATCGLEGRCSSN
jgi:hypothetical protein